MTEAPRQPNTSAGVTTGDRRPLATRELAVSHRLASRLAGWGWTPNGISIGGMVCGIAAGVALAATAWDPERAGPWFVLGAVLVQLRLLANMLDGMVAVATGRTSPVGELFNEIPDRVSDACTLVGLGYSAGGVPFLGWAAALWAVFTAYVRAEIRVAGGPAVFAGPQAKPQRMFLVTLCALYAGLAPAGWQPEVHVGQGPGWGAPALVAAAIVVGCLVTALRRLRLGAAALTGSGS